jgi:hypothetical protein
MTALEFLRHRFALVPTAAPPPRRPAARNIERDVHLEFPFIKLGSAPPCFPKAKASSCAQSQDPPPPTTPPPDG